MQVVLLRNRVGKSLSDTASAKPFALQFWIGYARAAPPGRRTTRRRDLINVAARTARHGRGYITLHLPGRWHRQTEWMNLSEAATGPPAATA